MELNKILAIIGGVVLLIVGISVTVFFSTTGSTTAGGEIDSNTNSVENRKYQQD